MCEHCASLFTAQYLDIFCHTAFTPKVSSDTLQNTPSLKLTIKQMMFVFKSKIFSLFFVFVQINL